MNDNTMAADAAPSSARERLMSDLRVVIADAEELLKMTAGQAGDKAADVRARIEERLARARAELTLMQAQAMNSVREAGEQADQYVRDNPWQAIGIGAGIGFVLGLLIARR